MYKYLQQELFYKLLYIQNTIHLQPIEYPQSRLTLQLLQLNIVNQRYGSLLILKESLLVIKKKGMLALVLMIATEWLCLCGFTSPPSNPRYTISAKNQIQNPMISTPIISPLPFKLYSSGIPGWNTKFNYLQIFDGCTSKLYYPNVNYCGMQFLDLDSNQCNEQYYQKLSLKGGRYFELKFDWFSTAPIQSTGVSVIWNNLVIDSFYDSQSKIQSKTYYVKSIDQTNQIAFQSLGTVDSQGLKIRNFSLRELIFYTIAFTDLQNQIKDTKYATIFKVFEYLNSSFLSVANSISAKSILTWVLGYVLEFNHFVLYDYHRLNHTLTADVILAGMRALDDQRGRLIDQYIYPFLNTDPQSILQDFAQQSNLTVRMQSLYPTYTLRPNGFLLEITDGFFVSFAATLLLFGLGALLFRLLSRSRLSLIVRECSLMGLFWVLCLDGRVEVLTFHFLSNALRLPSANFTHKLKNAALVHAYFAVFLFAVAAMLVLRSVYGGLSKHFNNCKRQSLCAALYASFAFGVYNVVLGALHRLLIDRPRTQLCSLLTFEAASLTLMTALLTKKFFRNTFLAAALWLMTSARLCFFASFLVFELQSDWGECISAVQQYAFVVFVGLWGLSAVICLLFRVGLVYRTVGKWCGERKSNKVAPQLQGKGKQEQILKQSEVFDVQSKSDILSLKQFMQSSTLIKESVGSKSINVLETVTRQQRKFRPKHAQIKPQ